MNFYLDFEATQPENEIIAIGAVAENGATFHRLVKPQFSSISKYISDMTHISVEDLEQAKTIDDAFFALNNWITEQEPNLMKCEFITYGDDAQFIKATLPAIKTDTAFLTAAYLLVKIKDCTKDTFKFFHGSISLIHAFNYVQSVETKQNHNPLEDALMLQKVHEYTLNNAPLTCHPLNSKFKDIVQEEVKMPSGTFFCKSSGKNATEHKFNSCDEAIDWYINTYIAKDQRASVHRENIMKHIMKSIRTKKKYAGYNWRRIKPNN